MNHAGEEKQSALVQAAEINREANMAFDQLTERCLGRRALPAVGSGKSLDEALARIAEQEFLRRDALEDFSQHPSIVYADRPEDMDPEAAEAGCA